MEIVAAGSPRFAFGHQGPQVPGQLQFGTYVPSPSEGGRGRRGRGQLQMPPAAPPPSRPPAAPRGGDRLRTLAVVQLQALAHASESEDEHPLETARLLARCSRVCKAWQRDALSKEVWHSLLHGAIGDDWPAWSAHRGLGPGGQPGAGRKEKPHAAFARLLDELRDQPSMFFRSALTMVRGTVLPIHRLSGKSLTRAELRRVALFAASITLYDPEGFSTRYDPSGTNRYDDGRSTTYTNVRGAFTVEELALAIGNFEAGTRGDGCATSEVLWDVTPWYTLPAGSFKLKWLPGDVDDDVEM